MPGLIPTLHYSRPGSVPALVVSQATRLTGDESGQLSPIGDGGGTQLRLVLSLMVLGVVVSVMLVVVVVL